MLDFIQGALTLIAIGGGFLLLWVLFVWPAALWWVSRRKGFKIGFFKGLVLSVIFNLVHGILVLLLWLAIYLPTRELDASLMKEVGLVAAFVFSGLLVGTLLVKWFGRTSYRAAMRGFALMWTGLLVVLALLGSVVTLDDPIDERLAKNLKWEEDPKPEENMYYALMGLHGARTEDPHEVGRKLVKIFNKAFVAEDWATARQYASSPEVKNIGWQELQGAEIEWPEAASDCNECLADERCLESLIGIHQENKDVMESYLGLNQYSRFDSAVYPNPFAPMPNYQLIKRLNCVALASSQQNFQSNQLRFGADELKREIGFGRKVFGTSDSFDAKMGGAALLIRSLKVYAKLLDCDGFVSGGHLYDDEVKPLSHEETSMAEVLTNEYRTLSWLLARINHSDIPYMDDIPFRVLPKLVSRFLYKKGVTINAAGRCFDELIDYTSKSPWENRQLGNNVPTLSFTPEERLRSPVATLLLEEILPSYFGFYDKVLSADGVLRMVGLKQSIRSRGIEKDGVRAFLDGSPESLRNPWTGKPFDWDGDREVLFFTNPAIDKPLEIPIPFATSGACPIPPSLPSGQ